jgi:hypothetical protein
MPFTAAEVAELKAEGQAMKLNFSEHVLDTPAEIIGGLVFEMRAMGVNEDDVLHDVELLVRSSDFTREELREARSVLRSLHYDRKLIALLTKLSNRARPREVYRPGRGSYALPRTSGSRPPQVGRRPDEVALALELLLPRAPGRI